MVSRGVVVVGYQVLRIFILSPQNLPLSNGRKVAMRCEKSYKYT